MFARFGIPDVVRSDCGKQFETEFKEFAKQYDFKHITSSPKYQQSNGAAEAAVKIAKNIIKKCPNVQEGLLAYRATPLENGYSPAELLFSRKIRSTIPMLPSHLSTRVNHRVVRDFEEKRKENQSRLYNRRHRVRQLSRLEKDDAVWIIDMRVYGVVVKQLETPNSYVIKTENDSVIKCNRWHLIPAPYKKGSFKTSNCQYVPNDIGENKSNDLNANAESGENNLSVSNEAEERANDNLSADNEIDGNKQGRAKRNCGPPKFFVNIVTH